MAKDIHDLSLLDIAPPSITYDKNIRDIIASFSKNIGQVSEDISEAFIISKIDSLPEQVLDLLAWQWHVDFYELANNLTAKREMVKNSITWHRHTGTRGAIIKALAMLGVEAKFTPWYEDDDNKDNPYTFAIDAKLTGDFWQRVNWTKPTQTIRTAILNSKAARSYMSKLYVYIEANAELKFSFGNFLSLGIVHDLKIKYKNQAKNNLAFSVGGKFISGAEYHINLAKSFNANSSMIFNSGIKNITGIFNAIKK